MTIRPSPHGSTVMSAPASASISSVWARVVTRSRTMVGPIGGEAGQQDGGLHLGAGHLGRPVDAVQGPALDGERGPALRARTLDGGPHQLEGLGHPVHGAGTERRSRRSRTVSHGNPATRPASRRMDVPELPQSRAMGGWWSRLRPPGASRCRRHCCSTPTPIASTAASDAATSAPSDKSVDDRGALGQRGEEDGPVRDRLLPRRAHRAAARRHHLAPRGSAAPS